MYSPEASAIKTNIDELMFHENPVDQIISMQYSIRADFVHKEVNTTIVEDPESYWNKERKLTSTYYQHHVYKHAARLISKKPSSRVADVGCGYPMKTKNLISPVASSITLFDQPSMQILINKDFPEFEFIPVNFESDCHSNETFDFVICADVIEHMADPNQLMRTIMRLIGGQGIAVISTPERDSMRGENCIQSPNKFHVREWNLSEFASYVKSCGFEILDHRKLPEGKLSVFETVASLIMRKRDPAKYFGNQMVVCKRAGAFPKS